MSRSKSRSRSRSRRRNRNMNRSNLVAKARIDKFLLLNRCEACDSMLSLLGQRPGLRHCLAQPCSSCKRVSRPLPEDKASPLGPLFTQRRNEPGPQSSRSSPGQSEIRWSLICIRRGWLESGKSNKRRVQEVRSLNDGGRQARAKESS